MNISNGSGSSALPDPGNRLIGRKRDVDQVVRMLTSPETRLLTLTGPGGVGKTRLAIEAVRRCRDSFRDGLIFVPLASLSDASAVMPAVANALALEHYSEHDIASEVQLEIRDRQLLLVLDNFEHVSDAAVDVAELLQACPSLTVLVTSRSRLRLRAERVYNVAPLSTPKGIDVDDRAAVAAVSSVELFMDRACATFPEFDVTNENAATVAAICDRLDGLPLAIELAATRVDHLSLDTLLAQLDQHLLRTPAGPRDLPARQQSLVAAIDWSYNLLDLQSQRLFSLLSVFAGPWTVDAAAAVADIASCDAEALIAKLLENSLVLRQGQLNGEAAFGMLSTIHTFAEAKLESSGEAQKARERHARWCLEFAEDETSGYDHLLARDAWIVVHDLNAAAGWLEANGDPDDFARLATAIVTHAPLIDSMSEGKSLLSRALDRTVERRSVSRLRLLWQAGHIAHLNGDDAIAFDLLNASIVLGRELGAVAELAKPLSSLGQIYQEQGKFDLAHETLSEALALSRTAGDNFMVAYSLMLKSLIAAEQSDHGKGCEFASQAVELLSEIGAPPGELGYAKQILGVNYLLSGRHNVAGSALRESIETDPENGWVAGLAIATLANLAVSIKVPNPDRAAVLAGFMDSYLRNRHVRVIMPERRLLEEAIERSRKLLGDRRFGDSFATGQAMEFPDAVEFALAADDAQPVSPTLDDRARGLDQLTRREREILRFIGRGSRNREIAEALYISEKTVETHVSNILGKLRVDTRTAAAKRATELGLLE